jgi:hypothetical protein
MIVTRPWLVGRSPRGGLHGYCATLTLADRRLRGESAAIIIRLHRAPVASVATAYPRIGEACRARLRRQIDVAQIDQHVAAHHGLDLVEIKSVGIDQARSGVAGDLQSGQASGPCKKSPACQITQCSGELSSKPKAFRNPSRQRILEFGPADHLLSGLGVSDLSNDTRE